MSDLIKEFNEMKKKVNDFASVKEWCVAANNIISDLNSKLLALEMANISLGNTITAIANALDKKGVVSDPEIITELRIISDNKTKEEIQKEVDNGALLQTALITEAAFIICSHVRNGTKISDYRYISVVDLTDEAKKSILGKTTGVSFVDVVKDNTNEFTVLEIYEKIG